MVINSENLMRTYCPTIYDLYIKYGFTNWTDLDARMATQLTTGGIFNTHIVGLLLEIHTKKDTFLKAIADRYDALVAKLIRLFPHLEPKIWDSITGKFTNFEGWNYLNPIGEFSILEKLLDSGLFELIDFEAPFPNGRPKDLLLKVLSNGSTMLVEIYNIHVDPDNPNIKKELLKKIKKKIKREIEGVLATDAQYQTLVFCPVVWYLRIEQMHRDYSFYSEFAKSKGQNHMLARPTMGFCTYYQVNKQLLFDEASVMVEKMRALNVLP